MAKKKKMRRKGRLMLFGLVLLIGAAVVIGLFTVVPVLTKSSGERRLVGHWEFQPQTQQEQPANPAAPGQPIPPTQPAQPGPGGKSGIQDKAREFFKNFGKQLEQWATAMTPNMAVTFESDGTYSESMGFGGRRQVVTGQWEVVEPGEDRIVVRVYHDENNRSRATDLTISFEGDDVMLYPGGAGNPIRMVRQQAP